MATRMDEVWEDQADQQDDGEMYLWYESQADLELQRAIYEDEWHEYETVTTIH